MVGVGEEGNEWERGAQTAEIQTTDAEHRASKSSPRYNDVASFFNVNPPFCIFFIPLS